MDSLFFIRLVLTVLVAALVTFEPPLQAQEKAPKPAEFDLTKFAQLPVRFNGRVTTYEVVAKNYLRRFGGRDVCYDAEGKEQPAVRWLLDVMTAQPNRDHWRIFKIENPELLKLLDFKPQPDEKLKASGFSIDSLLDQGQLLVQHAQKIEQKSVSERSPTDREFLFLYVELLRYRDLEMSFDSRDLGNPATVRRIPAKLDYILQRPLPRFVPGANGKAWQVYFVATVDDAIAGNADKNSFLNQLNRILSAHEAKDAGAFNAAVIAYAQSVAKIDALKSPFHFTPPKGWLETGVEASSEGFFYSDADGVGRPIVDLTLPGSNDSVFKINYFQDQEISRETLINAWRVQIGLAPLSDDEVRKTWQAAKVAGRDAVSIDIQTPDDVNRPTPLQYVTTVLQENGQTLVFSFSAEPSLVARQKEAHRELMESFQISSMKELAEWFPVSAKAPAQPARQLLAAIIPDGKKVWTFVTSDYDRRLEQHRDKFLNFIKSVKVTGGPNAKATLDWTLPEGWEKIGDFGEPTLLMGQGENALPVMISPLGEASENTVATLVDYWAKKLNAGKLSETQRGNCIKEMEISGRKAFLVEIQGKAKEKEKENKKENAAVKTKPANELTHKPPKNWKALPPRPLVHSSFEITNGADKAAVTIVALPAGGNLGPNINRWRAQLKLPPEDEKAAIEKTKPVPVGKTENGTLVDLHNPETEQRIIAAVVKHAGKDWYFKMMGSEELVEAERENLQAFLKSVEFPEPADMK